MRPAFLVVAHILGTVGLAGELRAQIVTDFPSRLRRHRTVHLGDELRPYRVAGWRLQGDRATLRLESVDDVATAHALVGAEVCVPTEAAARPPKGEYFWHDVIGLTVLTEGGEELGHVADIVRTGANDVYVVEGPRGRVMIPAIESVIKEMSPADGRIVIHPLPGLLED